jgi:hypothetical protein
VLVDADDRMSGAGVPGGGGGAMELDVEDDPEGEDVHRIDWVSMGDVVVRLQQAVEARAEGPTRTLVRVLVELATGELGEEVDGWWLLLRTPKSIRAMKRHRIKLEACRRRMRRLVRLLCGRSEVEEILYRAIADGDARTLNGYAMRYFVDRQDYLSASTCRSRVKQWRDDEFRLPND